MINYPEVFKMIRNDKIVADGCIFNNGKCVVNWLGEFSSTVVWNSYEDMKNVNGHPGTRIELAKIKDDRKIEYKEDEDEDEDEDNKKEESTERKIINIEDITEDNVYEYYICKECKKIVHISEDPIRGNYDTIITEYLHDGATVVKCKECNLKAATASQKLFSKYKLIGMKQYLSENTAKKDNFD